MTADSTTQKAEDRQAPSERPPLAALTIICHPELQRIGQRVLLTALEEGREVAVSRSTPDFVAPGSVWGVALDDPYLSRSPLVLQPLKAGAIELRAAKSGTAVVANGQRVDGSRVFTSELIDSGVTLELASRIVLLLHRLPAAIRDSSRNGDLVGASAGIEQVRSAIERIADLDVPVLLRGESGTGKELVARAVHEAGPRRKKPFVAVNLGAIPSSLAASELFGSVKGAFTGAVATQQGYFRAAQGGTLFLDEVGEAPTEVQVMLLRALETGEIFPVGSQHALEVKVRIVAATDSDLEARVRSGNFKAPLLHRLAAYEIWLPPLRQRRDDIGRLLVHFASQELASIDHGSPLLESKPQDPPWLPAALAARLARYPWPGNVRQLRNVVRQLVIDGRDKQQLEAGERVERLLAERLPTAEQPLEVEAVAARRTPSGIEFTELESILAACNYNLAAAARELGVSRPSLYNLIRRHPTLRIADEIPFDELRQAIVAADGDETLASRRLRISVRALRRRLARSESE